MWDEVNAKLRQYLRKVLEVPVDLPITPEDPAIRIRSLCTEAIKHNEHVRKLVQIRVGAVSLPGEQVSIEDPERFLTEVLEGLLFTIKNQKQTDETVRTAINNLKAKNQDLEVRYEKLRQQHTDLLGSTVQKEETEDVEEDVEHVG